MKIPVPIRLLALALLLTVPISGQLDLPDPPVGADGGWGGPKRSRRGGIPGLELPSEQARKRVDVGRGAPEPKADFEAVETGRPLSGAPAPAMELLNSVCRGRELELSEQLLAMGPAGLQAARVGLNSLEGPVRLTALRVLLARGLESDRGLVLKSLRKRVPKRSAGALLDVLAELDPVATSPKFLIDLLDHPQGSMRSAAARQLATNLHAAHIGDLEGALNSERADTRLHVVELIGRLELGQVDDVEDADTSTAVDLLLQTLGDSDPRVAALAARSLAHSHKPSMGSRLLARIQLDPSLSRAQSYALLAIIEREDLLGQALLDEEHVDLLLRNLADGSDLAVGSAACALAGIGFRSPRATGSPWLDLLVPHHLVRIISGTEFFRDLISLRTPAQRRLVLLTGRDFGGDGHAWQSWWTSAARDFRARRAALPGSLEDAEALRVDYRDFGLNSSLSLCGSKAEFDLGDSQEMFVLSKHQSVDLFRVLEREGLFTAERLPTTRGVNLGSVRELTLHSGGLRKTVSSGSSTAEPWFERVVDVLEALRLKNKWQLFFPLDRRAEQPAAWSDELRFWAEEHEAGERDRRLKRLVLTGLDSLEGSRIDDGLSELERLFERSAVADASDCQPLLQRIRLEPFYSRTASRLVQIWLTAARAEQVSNVQAKDQALSLAIDGSRAIDTVLARGLSKLLAEQFATAATDDLVPIFRACDAAFVRDQANSSHPALRAASARALARDPDAVASGILLRLLADSDFEVEAAAVRALGERCALTSDRSEPAGERALWADEIYDRTKTGTGAVRLAALAALARSGDERAMAALLPALSDPAAAVQLVAAEGLASIGDASVAPILISLLRRGPKSIAYGTARSGLARLGAGAHEELLRCVHKREPGLSREAALILAEGGIPDVASPLMVMLTEDPADERVAWELAVLTCVDLRSESDPAGAWWSWWDTVRHEDARTWLFAAAERIGLRAPAEGAIDGSGTRAGAEFLFRLAQAESEHLATRAARELARLLGEDFALPNGALEREQILNGNWPR